MASAGEKNLIIVLNEANSPIFMGNTVLAVEEGRHVFIDITPYIAEHLMTNFPESVENVENSQPIDATVSNASTAAPAMKQTEKGAPQRESILNNLAKSSASLQPSNLEEDASGVGDYVAMTFYRPRGTLARAIFEKVHNDQYLDGYDTRLWYKLVHQLPQYFQAKFVSFEQPDEITVGWLEKAKLLSANIWLQIWHTIARMLLGLFMTQTDVNGFLKRGSMFILSEEQFAKLLLVSGFNIGHFRNRNSVDILDIGAGDGEITIRLANSVIQMGENIQLKVYATETSWTMRDRLQKQHVVDKIRDVSNIPLISCLNVLDRCIDPYQIIQDIYDILAPNGRVVIALVLPYAHYVEFNNSHMPLRPLLPHWPEKARQFSFEAEATLFFEILENIGFKVEAWTKAPYLCEGDLRQSFYWLVDLVVILSKK